MITQLSSSHQSLTENRDQQPGPNCTSLIHVLQSLNLWNQKTLDIANTNFLDTFEWTATQKLHVFFRNTIWLRGSEHVWSGTDFQTCSFCYWTQNWVTVHVLPAPQPHSTKSVFNCPSTYLMQKAEL